MLVVGIVTASRCSVSLSASCARYGSPCLGYVDSIAHILSKVKHYFSVFRKCFLTFTRWKGLFSASLLQSALCAPVSARSARVTLVALTVGFMALFHLPGLSPVDFYWQSRVIICGCVGASLRRIEGWKGLGEIPVAFRRGYLTIPCRFCQHLFASFLFIVCSHICLHTLHPLSPISRE